MLAPRILLILPRSLSWIRLETPS